jgi:hypothetical protein
VQWLGIVVVDDGEGLAHPKCIGHGENARMTLAGRHNANIYKGWGRLGFGHGSFSAGLGK